MPTFINTKKSERYQKNTQYMIAYCSMIPEIPAKNSLDTEYPKPPARPAMC